MGAKAAKRNPEIEGGGHAWFAIVLAGVMTLLWGAAILLAVFAALFAE